MIKKIFVGIFVSITSCFSSGSKADINTNRPDTAIDTDIIMDNNKNTATDAVFPNDKPPIIKLNESFFDVSAAINKANPHYIQIGDIHDFQMQKDTMATYLKNLGVTDLLPEFIARRLELQAQRNTYMLSPEIGKKFAPTDDGVFAGQYFIESYKGNYKLDVGDLRYTAGQDALYHFGNRDDYYILGQIEGWLMQNTNQETANKFSAAAIKIAQDRNTNENSTLDRMTLEGWNEYSAANKAYFLELYNLIDETITQANSNFTIAPEAQASLQKFIAHEKKNTDEIYELRLKEPAEFQAYKITKLYQKDPNASAATVFGIRHNEANVEAVQAALKDSLGITASAVIINSVGVKSLPPGQENVSYVSFGSNNVMRIIVAFDVNQSINAGERYPEDAVFASLEGIEDKLSRQHYIVTAEKPLLKMSAFQEFAKNSSIARESFKDNDVGIGK